MNAVHLNARAAGKKQALLGTLAIIVLTLLAYSPVFTAGFIWDDDDYVTTNTHLNDVSGLIKLWQPGTTKQYYPVVFTSFWIEHQLWDLHAGGYHVVNVLLHIANALLIWRLGVRIKLPGAWLIAAIFALHPVHVESVAWITERKNVLSGLFYLSAMLCYLRFDEGLEKRAGAIGVWTWYAAALGLFVLALLSKSVTCSLPAALILVMLFQRKRINVRRLAPLLPLFIIGLVLAMHTAALERVHVGAQGEEFQFTFIERVLIASRALLFYPQKIIAPWPVMFIYPRWTIDAGSAVAYLPVIAALLIAAVSIWLFLRGWRGMALALAFYAGTIFPALGFFNIYPMRFSFVADHFQYLASLGIIALIAAGLVKLFGKRVLYAGAAVIAILTMLTWMQAVTYDSAESVYRDTLSKNNEAWMPHNNLANILMEREPPDLAEAELHYREALRIKPDHYTAQSNLALALAMQGRADDAIAECQKAIALVHEKMKRAGVTRPPKYLASDYELLGRLRQAKGENELADDAFRQAKSISQGN